MAKTRSKKTAPTPTPSRGGRRAGAGRKPVAGVAMDQGIYIRCSGEQKQALGAYIAEMNTERRAEGLPEVDLSTWIRELALKHSGNESLGMAARARAAADAASSIV